MKRHAASPKPNSGPWPWALAALLPLLSGGLPAALAQTNTPSNRYLLVVETAQSMQRRAAGVNNSVGELLSVGLKNQLRAGDTLGVWTFADDLYTGRFALQHWSPEQHRAICERVLTFVHEQAYQKEASYDKLLAALDRLVKASPFITVILVTDGEQPLHGTPFDSQINDIYKAWREREQKAQMPFVTVLRARQGTLTDFSVTPAPWPVELPALPAELQVARNTASKAEPAPKAPVSASPVLVFHGTDPTPSKVEAYTLTPKRTNAAPAIGSQSAQSLASAGAFSATSSEAPSEAPAAVTLTPSPDASKAPVLLAQAEPLPYQPPGAAHGPAPTPAPGSPATGQARHPAARPQSPPASSVAAPAPSDATRVQATAALPPTASQHRKTFWTAALALVAAVVGLGLLLARRTRPSSHVSLITRSLERQNK